MKDGRGSCSLRLDTCKPGYPSVTKKTASPRVSARSAFAGLPLGGHTEPEMTKMHPLAARTCLAEPQVVYIGAAKSCARVLLGAVGGAFDSSMVSSGA